MRALRLEAWQTPPVFRDVPEPTPDDDGVVVRVGGAGLCHTDVHVTRTLADRRFGYEPPFTLGHEVAGWVEAVGGNVTDIEIGQPVAVAGPWGCGECRRCRVGLENYCDRKATLAGSGAGLGFDGGLAEQVLVPHARHVVPLPDGVDPMTAAPLADAGSTSWHAVDRSRAKLGPGSVALVIGVGGLGHLAVQILRATTEALVVAVDARPEGRALAHQVGAHHVVDLAEQPELLDQLSGGEGYDVVLDFVGSNATLDTAVGVVRPLADLTIVGGGGGQVAVSMAMPREVSVQTTYWGTRSDLYEVLNLVARGDLTPHLTTYPLSAAPQALDDLADGRVSGRAVVVPDP